MIDIIEHGLKLQGLLRKKEIRVVERHFNLIDYLSKLALFACRRSGADLLCARGRAIFLHLREGTAVALLAPVAICALWHYVGTFGANTAHE